MTEAEFTDMCYRMLNPPPPKPLPYKVMLEQFNRSAGNMGKNCTVIPDCWLGLENVGGGAEHCVIIPRPREQ